MRFKILLYKICALNQHTQYTISPLHSFPHRQIQYQTEMGLFCSDEHCSFIYPFSHSPKTHISPFILTLIPTIKQPIHTLQIILIFTVLTVLGGEVTPLSYIIIFTHPFLIHKHSFPSIKTTHSTLQISMSHCHDNGGNIPLIPMSIPSHRSSTYRTYQTYSTTNKDSSKCLKLCMNTYLCNTKPDFHIRRLDLACLRNNWFRLLIVLAVRLVVVLVFVFPMLQTSRLKSFL